jgi:DNA-binding transcriptional LysR family regulator
MFCYSFNSLIVFYEVVKAGSFSKAADVLLMTQPGISNHVAQIEAQVGKRLLRREKGEFELTREGKMVFRYAEKIDTMARELENLIGAIKRDPKPLLKIGTTVVYSTVMMPSILDGFQKANPSIRIRLDSGSSEEMVRTVVSMENDVVVIANPRSSKKLYAFPLAREDLVLITPHDHPLAQRDSVSLREIEGYPLVIREEGSSTRKVVLSALELMRVKPSVLIEVRSTEFIKEWVSQGKGLSVLVTRAIFEEELKQLKVIPLKEPLALEVAVVFLKSKKYDTSIQKFVDYLKDLKAKSFF